MGAFFGLERYKTVPPHKSDQTNLRVAQSRCIKTELEVTNLTRTGVNTPNIADKNWAIRRLSKPKVRITQPLTRSCRQIHRLADVAASAMSNGIISQGNLS
jgi:hypothetical protein